MDDLLSIGEFSARCGLSAKMLRGYAAAGLLVPAAVDQVSGYRYYFEGQAHRARTIALLRRAEVPLAEIASFLRAPTEAQIDEWRHRLDAETDVRRRALAVVREHLRVDVKTPEGPRHLRPEHERKATMTNALSAATATDIGLVRATNQDAMLADDPLFAVADGMGGGGETASLLAVETLRATFAADRSPDGLVRGFREANRVVWERASTSAELEGMGTTLTALAAFPAGGGLAAVNIGDSRLYRLRDGRLEQLTEDHSIVAPLVRSGELTEEQARSHPQRKMLTQALGKGPDVDPDMIPVDCRAGDHLLLCTDGLFNDVAEQEIASVLGAAAADPDAAADQLVRLATTHGGNDNVAVVVIAVG